MIYYNKTNNNEIMTGIPPPRLDIVRFLSGSTGRRPWTGGAGSSRSMPGHQKITETKKLNIVEREPQNAIEGHKQ